MRTIICLVLFFSCNVWAMDPWYGRHKEGWHWYQDPPKKVKIKIKPTPPNPEQARDPLEWAKLTRQKGDWLQAQALRENSEASVLSYIKHQQEQALRANNFSESWDQVIRKHPKYDYSVTNPTAQFARKIYWDLQQQKSEEILAGFGQKYGLMFFFNSKCPYCVAEAPIIQQVAKRHGVELLGVSLDGGILPGLGQIELNNGIAEKLGVTSTPAIFAINFQSDDAFPLATGSIGANDLEARILGVIEYENLL